MKIQKDKIDLKKPKIYITLTTTSKRLNNVNRVLESLEKQILRPKKIILYISEEPYLLDNGIAKDNPMILKLLKIPLVDIRWTNNTGPYRKIMPFMDDYFSKKDKSNKIFITVDDDTLYPEYFVQNLYDKYLEYDCIIAYRGRKIEKNSSKIVEYKSWTKASCIPKLFHIPTGKDGVLYSTRFFTKDILDIKMAKKLAQTTDDLWIKWHCALNGIPAIILNPDAIDGAEKSFPLVDTTGESDKQGLYAIYNNNNNNSSFNDEVIVRLEAYSLYKYGYNLAFLDKLKF